jgi:hypothetical protein
MNLLHNNHKVAKKAYELGFLDDKDIGEWKYVNIFSFGSLLCLKWCYS